MWDTLCSSLKRYYIDIATLQPNDDLIKSKGDVILSCKQGYEYVIYDKDGIPFSVFLPGKKVNIL